MRKKVTTNRRLRIDAGNGVKMTFGEFTELILTKVREQLEENVTVRLNDVRKNNGVILTGMIIEEEKKNVSPTIYLNDFYEKFVKENNLEEIVEMILTIYRRNRLSDSLDVSFYTDYQAVKDNIVYKLINYDKNKELLEDVPFIPIHNLAIVFYCLLKGEVFANATILVHNAHLAMWQITIEELYKKALENTPVKLPVQILPIGELMKELFEDMELEEEQESLPLYVLSNEKRFQGAASVLYPHVMEDFAEKVKADVFILPSSIHEVILVPVSDETDKQKLHEMVTDINQTQVEAEEVLADSVYLYQRHNQEIIQLY